MWGSASNINSCRTSTSLASSLQLKRAETWNLGWWMPTSSSPKQKPKKVQYCPTQCSVSVRHCSVHTHFRNYLTPFLSFHSNYRPSNWTEAQRQPHRVPGIWDSKLLSESWSVFRCFSTFFSRDRIHNNHVASCSTQPVLLSTTSLLFCIFEWNDRAAVFKLWVPPPLGWVGGGVRGQGGSGEAYHEKGYSRRYNSKHLDCQQVRIAWFVLKKAWRGRKNSFMMMM